MNTQASVFAQVMAFLPMHEFRKCVRRYSGDYKIIFVQLMIRQP